MLRTNRHKRADSITELAYIEQRGLDGPIRISDEQLARQQQESTSRQPEFHSRFSGKTFGISGYGLIIIAFALFTCILAWFAFKAVISLFHL